MSSLLCRSDNASQSRRTKPEKFNPTRRNTCCELPSNSDDGGSSSVDGKSAVVYADSDWTIEWRNSYDSE